MSPFRDAPQVELGSLDVGLDEAAQKAMLALPRGGRLIAFHTEPGSVRATGTLGSIGLFALAVVAFVGATMGWFPGSLLDLGLVFLAVAFGGLSLAAVLRASDRESARLTRPAKVVGRGARRVLQRLTKLAWQAARSPERFGPRRIGALERTLAAAADPEIERWIPADVRGRAELLLARASALAAGPAWAGDEAQRRRAHALLQAAAERLSDPDPAEADLALLERAAVSSRVGRRARIGAFAGPGPIRIAIDEPASADAPGEDEAEARAALHQHR